MAENFKKLLKERNITINSIATALKISSTTLYYFRDGKGSLTTKKLNALAEHLNVSTDYLLDKSTDPTPVSAPATTVTNEPELSLQEKNVLELFRKLNQEQSEQAIKIMEQFAKLNDMVNNIGKNAMENMKNIK